MKLFRHSFFFSFLLITALPLAFSESTQIPETQKPPSAYDIYLGKFDKKFDFGAMNVLIGWTEILTQPADLYRAAGKNRWLYVAPGFGKGLFYGTVNTAGGLLNTATAFLPQFTLPLPGNGVDVKRITAS